MTPQEAQVFELLAARMLPALGMAAHPRRTPFTYSVFLAFADAAAVGTQLQDAIRIDSDCDFICTAIRVGARIDDTGRIAEGPVLDGASATGGWPDAPFLVQFEEAGRGRTLQDRALDARLLYGADGQSEQRLAVPKMLVGGTTLTVTVSLLKQAAAGTGWDCTVALLGYKDFDRPSRTWGMPVG